MSRYYTRSLYILSTLNGIIAFAISTALGAEIPMAVICSAFSMLIIATAIPLLQYLSDRRLLALRKGIKGPFLLDERVNIVVGNELRRCFVLTTGEAMFIISLENNKPVRLEIKKSEVKKVSVSEDLLLNIFLDYNKCIRILSPHNERICEELGAQGFGKWN